MKIKLVITSELKLKKCDVTILIILFIFRHDKINVMLPTAMG